MPELLWRTTANRALFARLDARRGETHVGVVTEDHPALAVGDTRRQPKTLFDVLHLFVGTVRNRLILRRLRLCGRGVATRLATRAGGLRRRCRLPAGGTLPALHLLLQPYLDQRLIRNVPRIGGHLDRVQQVLR